METASVFNDVKSVLEIDNSYTRCLNRYNIVTGGTDCHIVHVDLKRSPVAISGAKGELVLEEVDFFLTNPPKNEIHLASILHCLHPHIGEYQLQ